MSASNMTEPRPIRVLIVDDSAFVRRALVELLSRERGIEVVGTAVDPYAAREKIVELRPDVLTLDVEMPRMDGLSFLAALMRHQPMAVVVISSLTPRGSELAMRAYDLGAVEVLCKPGSSYSLSDHSAALVAAVRAAAAARLRVPIKAAVVRQASLGLTSTTAKVLALGASTGGTVALTEVLTGLPGDTPGTIIVQHMPPFFTAGFAARLDQCGAMRVAEAKGGEELMPGQAYLAPGGRHLAVVRSGAKYLVALNDGPPEHYQRPAVDVAFRSVAATAGANAVGVLLTGMGADGATGLLAMRTAGARTIAQDEATSVVYGMPKAAAECGAADEIQPLPAIADRIVQGFVSMARR